MRRRAWSWSWVGVVVLVVVAGVAIRGDVDTDGESAGERSGPGGRSTTTGGATTSTTVDPNAGEREAVIAARAAAEQAQWDAIGNPPNPGLPALAETMTGVALEQAISDADQEKRIGTYFRQGPAHRVTVRSVAIAGDVAYLDTCEVWDGRNIAGNGQVRELLSGTNTATVDEEMRKEGGRWKLAMSTVDVYSDGVSGCALDETLPEPGPTGAGESHRQAVIAARQAAERDWLAALVDPAAPAPTATYTGLLLTFFTGKDAERDSQFVVMQVPSRECPPVWVEGTNHGSAERSCVDRTWHGSTAWTFILRGDGVAFAPSSTSTVVVESVTWPDVESPTVAHLRTCRTYSLSRADGQALGTLPGRGTIRAAETMRLEGGRWKLSTRWGYTIDVGAPPCPPQT